MSIPRPIPDFGPFPVVDTTSDLKPDARWQLVERILATSPFQKSVHLPALLSYLAEHSIRAELDALTERRIGIAVFGKAVDYSPAEDSAVRVHVRQLRLRLHEYYAGEGRNESLMIGIPKGSYVLEFRSVAPETVPAPESVPLPAPKVRSKVRFRPRDALTGIALLTALGCAFGWYRAATAAQRASAVWPLDAVIKQNQPTRVVVADGNAMLRLLSNKSFSLDEYLQPGYFNRMIPGHLDQNVSKLIGYISDSQLTSYADLVTSSTLMKLAGPRADNIIVCSSRDLNERELERGNYIFIGGPTSNPWVSLFADRLNFEVVEETPGGRMYFLNKNPKPGEQRIYDGLKHTGSTGEDYATIALLPASGGGNVLILQGLRQESTEALGVLLANASERDALQQALGIHDSAQSPTYFEVLIRARAVAGAPVSINIVATRILKRG